MHGRVGRSMRRRPDTGGALCQGAGFDNVPAMTGPRREYSSLRVGEMVPGVIAGVTGHAFAIIIAWLVDQIMAPSQGGDMGNTEMTATFLATELLVALACLIVGWRFIPAEKRAARAGLVLGWLLGAVAIWIFAGGY